MTVELGIHGIFLSRRWQSPDRAMAAVRSIGVDRLQFCADQLDPFFSGDHATQDRLAADYRAAAERHGVEVVEYYTGKATHVVAGLGHMDAGVRDSMWRWLERGMELAAALGARTLGGHWHAFSNETLDDERRHAEARERMLEDFARMRELGAAKGLSGINVEQMYTPAEPPWLIAEAEWLLEELNRDPGIPVSLTLDTGHGASAAFGGDAADRSYAAWIERFGAVAEYVHVQQTPAGSSAHWPFTASRNAAGHVEIAEVLRALDAAHARHAAGDLGGLPQVERNVLVLESFPPSGQTEAEVLAELSESVAHVRAAIDERVALRGAAG